MKILWFSPTPSLFNKKIYGGWIASLEFELIKRKDIRLAIAFEYDNKYIHNSCTRNTVYYPICLSRSNLKRINLQFSEDYRWEQLNIEAQKIIQDFKPDLIQCFGTEWSFGCLFNNTKIPIIIHMQGFLNIDDAMEDMCLSPIEKIKYADNKFIGAVQNISHLHKRVQRQKHELAIIKNNKYFFGRTHWDKEIVQAYNPFAEYFCCNEMLRQELYFYSWKNHKSNKPTILTISQGGLLKGNEIILRTADYLTNVLKLDFTWRVAGNPSIMKMFEKKTGIKCKNVNIIQLGMIDVSSVAEEISMANIFVHPSIIDNSPNSICEAQLIGCPVIASNVGGVASLIDDGITGILYPYNEYHTLAFKIIRILKNEDLLNALSKNERIIARQRHNPESIVNNLCNIYATIIKKSRGKEYEI